MSRSSGTVIGGTAAGAGNVISGNGTGIQLSPGTIGITIQVQGNLIGTDLTGSSRTWATPVMVWRSMIPALGRPTSLLAEPAAGAGNVISGNNGDGIDLRAVTGVLVQGNFIGTQIDGVVRCNGEHGLNIVQTSNNTIGGTAPGAANRIAFNGAASDSWRRRHH